MKKGKKKYLITIASFMFLGTVIIWDYTVNIKIA